MLIGVALDDDDDDDYDLLTLNQPRSYVDWAGRRRYYNDRIELRVTGLKLCVNYEGQSGSGVTVPVSGLSHPIDFCIFTQLEKKKDGIFSTPVDIF